MAGIVPNAWTARLLEATVGRTAITTATVYVGLAFAIPDDPLDATLANITEVNTAGYARKSVPAFNAAVEGTNGLMRITTPTQFAFTAFSADMAQAAPYAFLADVLSGTAGLIRYLWELPQPVLAASGVPFTVPANTLTVE